ncbi:MAG: hypothetical protein EOP06_04590 [Proteobacteria bacterium]|nr:MAG: hypothetical protein EOP06_04590 [Pseudomonadota bacterium]
MKVALSLVCILLTLASFGCSKKEEAAETDVMHAYRLIDTGQLDQAIAFLERKQSENSEDNDILVTLSSAYALKSGVGIKSLAPIIFAAQKIEQLNSLKAEKKEPAETAKQPKSIAEGDAAKVFTAFSKVSAFWGIYSAIPKISEGDQIYLVHAIELLDQSVEMLTPRDHVYRAILKTVFLKTVIEDEIFSSSDALKVELDICNPDFTRLSETLNKSGKLLIDILDDAAIANPKKKDDLDKVKLNIAKSIDQATSSMNTLSSGDASVQSTVRNLALQYGFGKLVSCSP